MHNLQVLYERLSRTLVEMLPQSVNAFGRILDSTAKPRSRNCGGIRDEETESRQFILFLLIVHWPLSSLR